MTRVTLEDVDKGLSRDLLQGIINMAVRFEPAIETVTVFAPLRVSVQSGPMLRLITWACGLALLGWLVGQGRGGKDPQRGCLPAVKAKGTGTLWVEGSTNPNSKAALLALTRQVPSKQINLKLKLGLRGGFLVDPG